MENKIHRWYYLIDQKGEIHVYLSKRSRDSALSGRKGKAIEPSNPKVRRAKFFRELHKHF